MTDAPLVSVIIPFYNDEAYAKDCVQSVCKQTLQDIEIICIDDGSTDRTAEILERESREDGRIRFIGKENGGAGSARNLGLDLARGQFISVLDSDDEYNSKMLEIAALKAQLTSADVVFYRSNQYIQMEKSYRDTPWAIKLSQIPASETFTMQDINSNRFFAFQGWAWDKLFRRDFVESYGLRFQNTHIYNDMFFVFAACLLARKISYIDHVLIHQRKRGGSLSDAPSPYWGSLFDALLAVRKVVADTNIEEIRQDFEDYTLHMVRRQLSLCSGIDAHAMRIAIMEKWQEIFPVLLQVSTDF